MSKVRVIGSGLDHGFCQRKGALCIAHFRKYCGEAGHGIEVVGLLLQNQAETVLGLG